MRLPIRSLSVTTRQHVRTLSTRRLTPPSLRHSPVTRFASVPAPTRSTSLSINRWNWWERAKATRLRKGASKVLTKNPLSSTAAKADLMLSPTMCESSALRCRAILLPLPIPTPGLTSAQEATASSTATSYVAMESVYMSRPACNKGLTWSGTRS